MVSNIIICLYHYTLFLERDCGHGDMIFVVEKKRFLPCLYLRKMYIFGYLAGQSLVYYVHRIYIFMIFLNHLSCLFIVWTLEGVFNIWVDEQDCYAGAIRVLQAIIYRYVSRRFKKNITNSLSWCQFIVFYWQRHMASCTKPSQI